MASYTVVAAAIPGDLLSAVKWAKAGSKFTGFLATFAVFGALGFRLVRLRTEDWLCAMESGAARVIGLAFQRVDRRAAIIGEIGAWLLLAEFAAIVWRNLAASHGGGFSAGQLAEPEDYAQLILAPGMIIAFWSAIKGRRGGWQAALILGGALAFREVVTGRWQALVSPLHGAAAALWLGTLFVIVVAALPVILHEPVNQASRGPLIAGLMARFSPLALLSAGFVGLSGLLTSWLHLKYVAALWTTSYGRMLIIKLVFVACIVVMGALNWRRVLPALGNEEAADKLGRVSQWELVFALIVLVVTAVLVGTPQPKLPL